MAVHVVTVGTAATGRPALAAAPQAIGGRTGPSAPLGPQAALLPRSNNSCVAQMQAQARTSPLAPCPRARFSPSQSPAALQCANSASHRASPCMPCSVDSARRHPIASVAPCSARDPDSVISAQGHVARNHRTLSSTELSLRLASPATAAASFSFARQRTTSCRTSASFAGSRMASSPLIARGRIAGVRPSSSSSDAAPGTTTVDLSSPAAARRFTPTCRAQSSSSQLSASPVAPSPLLRPAGFLSFSAGEEEDRVVGGCCSLAAVVTGTAAEVAEDEVEQYEASPEFKAKALINSKEEYERMYKQSVEDPDTFWSNIARNFVWETEWEDDAKVHSENLDVRSGRIHVEWFKGARTNLCYNALDRWVAEGKGDQTAVIWEGNEPGHTLTLTYTDMLQRVCELAATLRRLGIRKGDFVTIYMPMVVELPIAMLACARIGAVHSVVFGGFSAESLAQRIQDCESPLLITASGVMRATKKIPLKAICDDALSLCPDLHVKCLVLCNETAVSRDSTPWTEGRDLWWHEEVAAATSSWSDLEGPAAAAEAAKVAPVEWVDGEDPLFLLYTSGSTGKPKGVLHTTGGYMVYTATTFKYAFDYRPGDVYWCTADCGWITGHSYVTYGPFLNGATQVLFEGVPSYPDWGRCWQIVDDHNVSIFYTAPTAIRAAMSAGDHLVKKHSRKSLRVLGSVGEPINPAAWSWYFNVVGDGRCPISDTWWQTETGGFMLTPLPGAWPQRPGSATFPFFGVQPAIVDEKGEELHGEASGYLCMKASWPSMFRTLYADHERYETNYFAPFKGYYFSGDGCRRDADGYYWLTGRVDDVINVSGHRIGTAEVESALVGHPLCAEAAVVGYEHDIKGQGIYAYVTLMDGTEPSEEIRRALIQTVRATIGAFAAPDKIHWAPGLPKTRSGKIMRRILRKIATREEEQLGDISTLADPQVVHQLIQLRGK